MYDEVTLSGLPLIGADDSGIVWGLHTVDGWGSPTGTLTLQQRARQHGAWAGDSFLAARPLVLSGEALLPSSGLGRSAQDTLIEAASLDETTLAVTEGSETRSLVVRRDGEVIISWSPLRDLLFDWSVQLVAPDPRKRGTALTGSTGLPSSSGGLTIPFTIPFSIDATVVSGQVALTNPGNIAGPVTLRIDGPITAPVVTHVSSGKSLVFASSLVLGEGEFVLVDMERREVLAQGIEPRNGWVVRREWSAFESGANVWAFSAAEMSTGTLTVEAVPTWQ